MVNDGDEPWLGELVLTRQSLTGRPLAKESVPVEAAPRSVARVALPAAVGDPDDPTAELLTVQLGDARVVSFFAEDTAVAFAPADYDARAEPAGSGYRVTVTARTLLRDLALFPDRLDPAASVDAMLVTLLPGEETTFHITTDRPLDPEALTSYPVLRCVNEPREHPS